MDCLTDNLLHTIIICMIPDVSSIKNLLATCSSIHNAGERIVEQQFVNPRYLNEDADVETSRFHGSCGDSCHEEYYQFGVCLDVRSHDRKSGFTEYCTTIIEEGIVCGQIFFIPSRGSCRAVVQLGPEGCELFGIQLVEFEFCCHLFEDVATLCPGYECTLVHPEGADLDRDHSEHYQDMMDLAWKYFYMQTPVRWDCELDTHEHALAEAEQRASGYHCGTCKLFDYEERGFYYSGLFA